MAITWIHVIPEISTQIFSLQRSERSKINTERLNKRIKQYVTATIVLLRLIKIQKHVRDA